MFRRTTFCHTMHRVRLSRMLLKRQTRSPMYAILMFIIVVQWYINFRRPETTNGSRRRVSSHQAIISKSRQLRYQLQMLAFKFSLREHVNAIAIREAHNTFTARQVAFNYSNKGLEQNRFQKWPVVISIGCALANILMFLESFREAVMNSSKEVVCIFVHTCQDASREHQVMAVNIINEIHFCSKFVWNISEPLQEIYTRFGKRHPSIERRQNSKLQWWNFIDKFFQRGIEEGFLFNGVIKDYKHDVLFIDSNVLLSPDLFQVAAYASRVKSHLPGIQQLSLGNWGGHNLINAHPDTFAVRKSRALHALAYGMNRSNWKVLLGLKENFLEDLNPDWSEAVGDALSKKSGDHPAQSIVPTLSRYWYITLNVTLQEKIINPEDSLARPGYPPWLISPRLINVNSATVNVGVRDSLGFLCNKAHTTNDGPMKNALCYCSFWIRRKTKRPSFPACFPQGNDACLDSY